MSIVLTTGGRSSILTQWLSYLNSFTLRLYQNSVVLSPTTVAADLTECTFPGYASVALVAWGSVYLNPFNQAETDEANHVFTMTGSSPVNSVYGYYVTDGFGNLIYAEANGSGPQAMASPGDTYTVLPRFMVGKLCPD